MNAILLLVTSVCAAALVIYVYHALSRKLVLWLFAPLLKRVQRRQMDQLVSDHKHDDKNLAA